MWAALLAQVFYLQESKRCKQRGSMCEFSVCFHDEQKVCGDDFFFTAFNVKFAPFVKCEFRILMKSGETKVFRQFRFPI